MTDMPPQDPHNGGDDGDGDDHDVADIARRARQAWGPQQTDAPGFNPDESHPMPPHNGGNGDDQLMEMARRLGAERASAARQRHHAQAITSGADLIAAGQIVAANGARTPIPIPGQVVQQPEAPDTPDTPDDDHPDDPVNLDTNAAIVAYIEARQGQGASPAIIVAELLDRGVPQDRVTNMVNIVIQNHDPTQPQPVPAPDVPDDRPQYVQLWDRVWPILLVIVAVFIGYAIGASVANVVQEHAAGDNEFLQEDIWATLAGFLFAGAVGAFVWSLFGNRRNNGQDEDANNNGGH